MPAVLMSFALADDRLKEVSFGLWEGLTGDEIGANWPVVANARDA